MANTFHCFAQLPLELRQRIWELSIEPRRVRVGGFSHSVYYTKTPSFPPSPPPPTLQVCAESRDYIQRYYNKAFVKGSPPRYTWVNFDMDTICMRDSSFPDFPAELALIKHLALEIPWDDEFFVRLVIVPGIKDNCGMIVIGEMPLLENLEFPMHLGDIEQWVSYMESWYDLDMYRPRFRARVVSKDPNHEPREINQDNYRKVDRDQRRKRMLEHPEWFDSDCEVSDDSDGPN
ncbi:hypothetical protein F5X68DRAFT_210161 [Plectosphaerella plurivora]|uniref:2EXR domain-containing protein n=1 Tax=Plectosphaerella plurivora TaxID=936078 RepID=A0A9P9A9T2_9PEZI|nr:hypothetical protein F5X68DRAFT_210161 [Plectosphaerella plurivora]